MSRKIPTTVECLNAQKSQSPFVDKNTVPCGFLRERAATRKLSLPKSFSFRNDQIPKSFNSIGYAI